MSGSADQSFKYLGIMSENILDDQAGSENGPAQSNVERLRTHLKPDGLARALLDVWATGDQQGAKARLRQVVDERFTIKKSGNDAAD
ncbi:hypothetical protein J4G43_049685 [Bradyrhizobium barranii subsp. barranii]|uniref:Uncharacterized protein n=1 Tax=Bradyrhizobium barranii subsp. barranii TaxID=2823807 RepID=A0A939LXU7_9BRAD|nr:hypothetical protein [Bradyrhizobium barranii]UEM12384.1 hypothetical protein J4G43_049685 [Bradyrhizobium barranii subsp. barranii]